MTVEPLKTVMRDAEQRLNECRQILRDEMGCAIFCKNDQDKRLLAAGTLALHYQTLEAEYRRLWKQKIPIDIEKIEV